MKSIFAEIFYLWSEQGELVLFRKEQRTWHVNAERWSEA